VEYVHIQSVQYSTNLSYSTEESVVNKVSVGQCMRMRIEHGMYGDIDGVCA
jgi:hypothetical protein